MKHILVFALLATAATPAPVPKKPTRAPATTSAATPSPADSLAGWSDLVWGMTSAQIVALHPDARSLGSGGPDYNAGALQFETGVLDRRFKAVLRFRNGGLESVSLIWFGSYDRNQHDAADRDGREFASAINAALTEKYGPPVTPVETKSFGNTESLSWTWSLSKTKINSYLELSTIGGPQVTLVYSDATGGNAKGNL